LADTNPRVATFLNLGFGSPSLSSAVPPLPKESVRAELARLQEESGLSLVWVAGGAVQVVLFSHHSMVEANGLPIKAKWLPDGAGPGVMSPDGTEVAFAFRREWPGPSYLGISWTHGSDFREYPNLQLGNSWDDICWSYDKSKLAMNVMNTKSVPNRNPSLQVVSVSSGDTQEIDSLGLVTSQCWSPDGKQLVYEAGESVQLYDVEANRSRVIAQGKHPTWSPDGNWIAILDHDSYYKIRPSGTERQVLFKKWHSESGLWWSPDSQFVAYVSQAGMFEGGFSLDVESYWLRVRRLKDNAETRISGEYADYQWVANTELFRAAESYILHAPGAPVQRINLVGVVGQVAKPGEYHLEGGETILQLLAAAGGLTPSAKADSISIVRLENKKRVRHIPFDFNKALQHREDDIPLQPGDVVTVP
jgi:Tol biopolymer transport system component